MHEHHGAPRCPALFTDVTLVNPVSESLRAFPAAILMQNQNQLGLLSEHHRHLASERTLYISDVNCGCPDVTTFSPDVVGLWTAPAGKLANQLSTNFNKILISVRSDKMAVTQVSSNKCAGGFQKVFEHDSTELKCKMKFAIYLPPKAETDKCPVMYWLSGLTCTEQNFITKAGSQLAAAEHGIIIVAPDTSPRGCNIEGEDESWDFGTGAGFYVDATQDPWKTNYRMYSYVTEELPKLINANFPTDPDRMSVSGHSMGGHGALTCALKNPGKYKAVSAFAPICNPMQCPWGQKAFSGYLGSDRSTWEAYDATVLAAAYSGPQLDILIDQGRDDQFLSASQLLPDNLIAVCSEKKIPVVFRLQPGYDHSYFFIYSFMNDHIKHHAKYLNA